jgi:hypothetical protein
MERLGLDTTLYREEIRKVHSRLNAHMPTRGPHQRRAFHWYYERFGLVRFDATTLAALDVDVAAVDSCVRTKG